MIHLPDTSVQFTAVVDSIWLPGSTVAAPDRPPIVGTNKDLLSIEVLESLHRIHRDGPSLLCLQIWHILTLWPVVIAVPIGRLRQCRLLSMPPPFFFGGFGSVGWECRGCRRYIFTSWAWLDKSRVGLDDDEGSEIAHDHQGEEEEEQNEDGNGEPVLSSLTDKVLSCDSIPNGSASQTEPDLVVAQRRRD